MVPGSSHLQTTHTPYRTARPPTAPPRRERDEGMGQRRRSTRNVQTTTLTRHSVVVLSRHLGPGALFTRAQDVQTVPLSRNVWEGKVARHAARRFSHFPGQPPPPLSLVRQESDDYPIRPVSSTPSFADRPNPSPRPPLTLLRAPAPRPFSQNCLSLLLRYGPVTLLVLR